MDTSAMLDGISVPGGRGKEGEFLNRKMLRGMHNRTVHIRPLVQRRYPEGPWLPPFDDPWVVDAQIIGPGAVVRLLNQATGHFVDLFADSVQEYREPSFLVLRERLALVGHAVQREPLADPRLAYAAAARLTRRKKS